MTRLPDQTELKELFNYDPDTGVVTRKKCTANRHVLGEVVGFAGSRGYLQAAVRSVKYPLHRLIWCLVTGEWPEGDIDHINRNRADNRLANLRAVTRSENNHNAGMSRRNKSGYTGVCWDKAKNSWIANICVGGKTKHIGRYASAERAAEARKQAKAVYHPTAPAL